MAFFGICQLSVSFSLQFLIYLTFFPVLIFTIGFLFSLPHSSKIAGYWGFFVPFIDLVFALTTLVGGEIFKNAAIFEWRSLLTYLCWAGAVVLNTFNDFTVQ
ncbi:MAG: hypothetical protein ACFFFG_15200 [Candidatus Thorarchaeota archaeon]